MVTCGWFDFVFYSFIFMFFLIGVLATLYDLFSHISFGIKKSFFYQYGKNKFSNPFTNILFFGFGLLGGIYLLVKSTFLIEKCWNFLK